MSTQTFDNCSMYLKGEFMGNIYRTDVRELRITTGVVYAQYVDAIRVEWLAKGARKRRGIVLTYRPFLVVLSPEQAFEPEAMCSVKLDDEVSASKYSSFDDGWVRDFMAEMDRRKATPLFSHVPEATLA